MPENHGAHQVQVSRTLRTCCEQGEAGRGGRC